MKRNPHNSLLIPTFVWLKDFLIEFFLAYLSQRFFYWQNFANLPPVAKGLLQPLLQPYEENHSFREDPRAVSYG